MSMLVTGAAGFIGSSIVRRAHLGGDVPVHALTRRPCPELESHAKVHVGDARHAGLGLPPRDAAELAEVTEAIVATAGPVDLSLTPRAAQTEHLAPLRGTLEFAHRCQRLRTVVVVSSMVAVGDTGERLRSDHEPAWPKHRNFYEWAKLEGERLARASGLPVDVVRPGQVVNATDGSARTRQPGGLFEILPLLAAGWPLPVGRLGPFWCCPVDFAADIVLDKARAGRGGSAVWAVDPRAPAVAEVLDVINARHGLRIKRIHSARLARAVATIARPKLLDLPMTRQILEYTTAAWHLDLTCLERLLAEGRVKPPPDRRYLLDTIDHEMSRLREFS